MWEKQQQAAFDSLKSVISTATVLAYFDINKETVLTVDASSTGLGVVIMQGGKLIAFSSKTLTTSERRLANIERERDVSYCMGSTEISHLRIRMKSHVETDHKPLESSSRNH